MVKECIHVHIGQAGCQVGAACWELYCQEHEVDPGGQRPEHLKYAEGDETFESFFDETPGGQFVPRAVFVDTDPTTRDEIFANRHGRLFHPDSVIGYKQDCKSNYFEGRSMASLFKIQEDVLDRIRKAADQCSNLQGFFVMHGFGGGTGSGIGVEVLHELHAQFDRKTIFQPAIFPSNHLSSCIVEPYNCIFTTFYTRDVVNLTPMMDNQAVYRMCKKNLHLEYPDFVHINRLLAQCISACTTSLRYDSILNATMLEICTNLVPHHEYRYPVLALAPVRHPQKGHHESLSTQQIVTDLFEEQNMLADCGQYLKLNRYLAACVLLRGEERHQKDDKDTRNLAASRPDLAATMRSSAGAKLEPNEYMAPIQVNAAAKYLHQLLNPTLTHRRPIRWAWLACRRRSPRASWPRLAARAHCSATRPQCASSLSGSTRSSASSSTTKPMSGSSSRRMARLTASTRPGRVSWRSSTSTKN
mmetsp:Transcript_36247/g.103589  ORF Transcript_36247/g.103589 Transcript_36247/m.103589 type:complete len:473 (+) Transcript_36247:66-1484(+)